ncbi:MJ1255/VC2487 family glycosyltransferase [Marinicella rhabdoformis]|uniref:MJ1255/VC2487 family glycosyltransferase n=1 Tax=Marinicella rhabdoformis TaxID=2580566 RepID=UPI0012AEB766|nr:MJ1255/VC2487 family glycosyltransferase [Marinicella rhabdoformis]
MRVLYGVQGTGNGHITRARVMSKALSAAGIEVDYVFTGRPEGDYFDMECFANRSYRRGLTFHTENGRVCHGKTLVGNNVLQFRKDVRSLRANQYDLVLTDFEPVTAWACLKSKTPCLGIGHQYVFDYPVPQERPSLVTRQIYQHFAPVDDALALHWHHYDSAILPPIVEVHNGSTQLKKDSVLVYLPLECQQQVEELLSPFEAHQFIVYTASGKTSQHPHITFKTLSRNGFQADLKLCEYVIANAGFELSSEALSLGKKLLVRPLKGQSEQQSNALALISLTYGQAMQELNAEVVARFFNESQSTQITYPNVADYIAQWIAKGMPKRTPSWYQKCWQSVVINR